MILYQNSNVLIEQKGNYIKVKTNYQENLYTNISTSSLTKGYFTLFFINDYNHTKSLVILKSGIIIDNYDIIDERYIKSNILIVHKYRTVYIANIENGKVYSINADICDFDIKSKTAILKNYYTGESYLLNIDKDMNLVNKSNAIYLINNKLCIIEIRENDKTLYTNAFNNIIFTAPKYMRHLNYTLLYYDDKYMHIIGEDASKKVKKYLRDKITIKKTKDVYLYYYKPLFIYTTAKSKFAQSKIITENEYVMHLSLCI